MRDYLVTYQEGKKLKSWPVPPDGGCAFAVGWGIIIKNAFINGRYRDIFFKCHYR